MSEEFKRVNTGLTFVKLSGLKPGDEVVTGSYKHSKVIGEFGNTSHFFETENGDVAVNGSGHLNYLLKDMQPGTRVRIIYSGQETKAKGKYAGKPFHSFELYKSTAAPTAQAAPAPKLAIVAAPTSTANAPISKIDAKDDIDF